MFNDEPDGVSFLDLLIDEDAVGDLDGFLELDTEGGIDCNAGAVGDK